MLYPLITPVQFGKETIKEIDLTAPLKAKHLRNLVDPVSTGQMLDIVADLSGLSSVVIDELDPEDALAVVEIVGKKLKPGPKTGTTG